MLPLVFLFSGVYFPLGVMTYWLVSNLWTMGQQFIVIRNMPNPGSEADKAREARMGKRRERKGIVLIEEDDPEEEKDRGQRNQPKGKNRSKKKKRK